jgi:protein involved in polysaccharide export with SLBB domain
MSFTGELPMTHRLAEMEGTAGIRSRKYVVILSGLLLLAGLAGCAHPPPETSATAARSSASLSAVPAQPERQAMTMAPAKYLLGVNDELEVKFMDRPSMNEAARVRPDGMISLGLIGTVQASGRTPQELEEEIASRVRALGSESAGSASKKIYLIRPDDELDIKFSYMRNLNDSVTVLPDGKISLQLVNAVTAQGKSSEELSKELTQLYAKHVRMPELVVIVKKASSPQYLVDGKAYRANIADMRPVVVVRNYAAQQIFVGGEVGRPGVLNYRNSLTLSQAIVEAGGDKTTADMESVTVLRKGEDGRPVTIQKNLADLRSHAGDDMLLQPADVVLLPRSRIASVGLALDQYVFSIFPFIKNSSFAFINDITPSNRRQSTVTTVISP